MVLTTVLYGHSFFKTQLWFPLSLKASPGWERSISQLPPVPLRHRNKQASLSVNPWSLQYEHDAVWSPFECDAWRKMTSALLGNQNIKGRLCLSQLGATLIFSCLSLICASLVFWEYLNSTVFWARNRFSWHGWHCAIRQSPADYWTGESHLSPAEQNSKLSFVLPHVSAPIV